MAVWSLKPTWKKSLIERMYYVKGDNKVMIETGWRWGEFTVTTDDDNEPNIEAGADLWDCGYDVEMVEMNDGCWEEHDTSECDEETTEWLETFFEENSWMDLEEHDWIQTEAECILDCDPEFELLQKTDGTTPDDGEESGDSIACFSCDKTVAANDLIEMDGQLTCPYCHEGWVEPDNRDGNKKWPFA